MLYTGGLGMDKTLEQELQWKLKDYLVSQNILNGIVYDLVNIIFNVMGTPEQIRKTNYKQWIDTRNKIKNIIKGKE